jgi:hypothetical protein
MGLDNDLKKGYSDQKYLRFDQVRAKVHKTLNRFGEDSLDARI